MSRHVIVLWGRCNDGEEVRGVRASRTTLWDGSRGGFVRLGFGSRQLIGYIASVR